MSKVSLNILIQYFWVACVVAACFVTLYPSNPELERQGPPLFGTESHSGNKLWLQWAHQVTTASPTSHFGVPGWAKVCSSRGLVWQLCTVMVHNHPLICWSGGLIRLANTCSQVGSILHACEDISWWCLDGSLTHCELDVASTSPVIYLFSCMGLCT